MLAESMNPVVSWLHFWEGVESWSQYLYFSPELFFPLHSSLRHSKNHEEPRPNAKTKIHTCYILCSMVYINHNDPWTVEITQTILISLPKSNRYKCPQLYQARMMFQLSYSLHTRNNPSPHFRNALFFPMEYASLLIDGIHSRNWSSNWLVNRPY